MGESAIANINVLNDRSGMAAERALIPHRHADARPGGFDRAIANVDVLDKTAARHAGFQSHGNIQIRAVKTAILGKDIFHAAGDFTTHRDAAVAVLENAIPNHEVPAGDVDAAAVNVPSRLDGDSIIPVADMAILDQNIRAGIRVATVGVWAVGVHRDTRNGHIRAIKRMQHPHR